MISDHHTALVECAARWAKRKGFRVVATDAIAPVLDTGEKPDVIAWRSGVSILIECKTSRQDFLADRKKSVRLNPLIGVGDWRFMFCPVGLVSASELPEGWGLVEMDGQKFIEAGVPGNTQWIGDKPFRGNKEAENQFLYSMLVRR